MDYWDNKILEIGDCLYDFNTIDYFSAAINLFKALNYPVRRMEQFSDLTVHEFLVDLGKNESFINFSEEPAVLGIKSISILFVLNNQTEGLEYVKEYKDSTFLGQSIIVIGVELSEDEDCYDYAIPAITNFLNRLINTQILIMFKDKSKIAFSAKRRRVNKRDETQDAKGSNFQTEWLEICSPSEETILRNLELSFDNFRDENFYCMYCDMIGCIASEYLIDDFPIDDNINSHIKINDGMALYIRDIKNLYYGYDVAPTVLIDNGNSLDGIVEDTSCPDREALERILELFEESENKIIKSNEIGDITDSVNAENDYNHIALDGKNKDSDRHDELGGKVMQREVIQDIFNNLCSLITNVEELKEHYHTKRRNEPENLSIDELQKYVNDLFEKTKVADSFKNEITSLKDKFSSVINDFSCILDEINLYNFNNNQNTDIEESASCNLIEEPIGVSDSISINESTHGNSEDEILDEIKFPLKYGSISVKIELLKTYFTTISEFDDYNKQYFEIYDLKIRLLDHIKKNSPYKQPEHVFNNILKFLIEWEIISLFEGSKRGKYIIKDIKTLNEMINDPRMIVGLLKS